MLCISGHDQYVRKLKKKNRLAFSEHLSECTTNQEEYRRYSLVSIYKSDGPFCHKLL